MKLLLLSLCLLCLIGCGKGEHRQSGQRVVYPALTESPPPMLPGGSSLPEESVEVQQPVPVVEESWMEEHVRKEARKKELIKVLREKAAEADPDDQNTLTEEQIQERVNSEGFDIY